jgi:DNA-directed RNA polymerase specialized sigma24 family protein
MTAEDVCRIADCAVNKAMMRSKHLWRPEDREDARQEAIVAVLKVSRRRTDIENGYLFRTALLQVYMWMRKLIRRNRTVMLTARLDEWLATDSSYSSAIERLLISVGGLKQLLREQRSHVTKLTERAVEREIEYLRLLLQGYTYEEIAFRMAVTRKATWMMHDCLVDRLERIATGQKPPPRVLPLPSQASLNNLRKAGTDPEVKERRAATLRKTLQTPEGKRRWSEAARTSWVDPQIRKRHKAGLRRAWGKRKTGNRGTP